MNYANFTNKHVNIFHSSAFGILSRDKDYLIGSEWEEIGEIWFTKFLGNVIMENCMFNNTQLEADMNYLRKCEKILVLLCKQL